MPSFTYGLSSYERAEGDFPELPVVNLYAEEAPTEGGGVALQSRRGLDDRGADMGTGPVEALFRRDLVIGSTLHGVSGGKLYRDTVEIGPVPGPGPVSMAGNEIGLMVAAGSALYFYNGTDLVTVSFPDLAGVVHVSVGGGRYWLVREDSGKLYWTDALQSDVEALDFLTAESLPDRLLQTLWIDGGLIAFGSETIEFFQQTGNADLPIVPLTNMVIEKGIRATNCATGLGSTFACVTNENNVIVQSENNIISNAGLQAKIAASVGCRLFTFTLDGVEFLALRLDDETHCYNPRTGLWNEFATYGLTNWGVQCEASGVFGSAVDGKTLEWGAGYADAQATGGVLERRWRGGFPIEGGGVTINNAQVRCNVGQTQNLSGEYAEPLLEMRRSRDAGQTWGDWSPKSLGAQGAYRDKVRWRALGMASYPGFFAEWRLTAPVSLRVSGCFINEPWGGR